MRFKARLDWGRWGKGGQGGARLSKVWQGWERWGKAGQSGFIFTWKYNTWEGKWAGGKGDIFYLAFVLYSCLCFGSVPRLCWSERKLQKRDCGVGEKETKQ